MIIKKLAYKLFIASKLFIVRECIQKDLLNYSQPSQIKKLVEKVRSPIDKTIELKSELVRFDLNKSYELYKLLMGKIEFLLEKKDHLIIVKSEELQNLPFSLLISEKPQETGDEYNDYKNAKWLINDLKHSFFAKNIFQKTKNIRFLLHASIS